MNFSNIIKVERPFEKEYKFSIVIPSWNNLEYLQLCVKSILANSTFHNQIIIMVNEGKDGTLDWVRNNARLDYVYSEENIGICYGLNACRSLVKSEYFLYANDDMYMLPEWDEELYREIEKIGHRNFMLSSTMIEPNESGNPCVIVKDYGDNTKNFQEELILKEFAALHKDDWTGSTWPPNVLHIDMYDLVGGMSTEFSPGMYSDPDLSMKLWNAGVRHFRGIGNSRVYHFGRKSTKRVKVNKGKDMFLQKWGISASNFTKYYLRRGDKFTGDLGEPIIPASVKLKDRLKKLRVI